MTDRDLLELAAKAYWGDEIDDVCSVRWLEEDKAIGFIHGDNQDHNGEDREFVWNPLTDDGDALRLAVKLNLIIECMVGQSAARTFNNKYGGCVDHADSQQYPKRDFNPDPYAATRRAIVRAAAEIGRATP